MQYLMRLESGFCITKTMILAYHGVSARDVWRGKPVHSNFDRALLPHEGVAELLLCLVLPFCKPNYLF